MIPEYALSPDEDLTVALGPDGIWGGAAGADLLDACAEDRPVERQ